MKDENMSHSTAKEEMDKGVSQDNPDLRDNFFKVKHVFDILIREAPYLLDDKSLQLAMEKGPKETFLILIDACRKSLGIESMEDVELLVETFYEFGAKKKARVEEEDERRRQEREENMSNHNA